METLCIKHVKTTGSVSVYNLNVDDLKHMQCENLVIVLQESQNGVRKQKRKHIDSGGEKGVSFFSYCQMASERMRERQKFRTSEIYLSACASFMRFRNGKDVPIGELNGQIVEEYEVWLKSKGLKRNTIGFYMRVMRAIYNKAVKQGIVLQNNPFENVYAGVDRTVKRAISEKNINSLKRLSPVTQAEDFARDVFLLSFYLRGISFVDLAYLKKSDLRNGVLNYCRKKTGQEFWIGWEPCMQGIVEKWRLPDSPYLLPIIPCSSDNIRFGYRKSLHDVNSSLKALGWRLKFPVTLTTYVARHSWASIAKQKGIDINVISESMGHDNINTTQIYLDGMEQRKLDEANRKVIGE